MVTRLPVVFALASFGAVALGCNPTTHPDDHVLVSYPDAEAFEPPPEFSGAWTGKVERKHGELQIGQLRAREYFANFTADDGSLDIALHMEQSMTSTANGAQVPSNRLLFTWQDGSGQRGHGWFKIDEAGARLDGSSGLGERVDGYVWLFLR